MIEFRKYITEEYLIEGNDEGKLKHLTHLEDHIIHNGHKGAGIAAQHLDDMHNILSGKTSSSTVSTKYDGAPSIVFGKHPKTGQFFVATKSAFNKTPKINFTPEDIDRNHGHAPGLADKLKQALEHIPKIMPSDGGVYQADLMHTKEDVSKKDGMVHFQPNTIKYSIGEDHPHGSAAMASKLGLVVHTKYTGRGELSDMNAQPLDRKSRLGFQNHVDVHNIDPSINVNPDNYTAQDRAEFTNYKTLAQKAYSRMKPEAEDALQGHGIDLEAHINHMVRTGGEPSVEGYIQHLYNKGEREASKLKTETGKKQRLEKYNKMAQHVSENSDHFKSVLDTHKHLQNAKNVLERVIAKNNPFKHTVNGEDVGPEGAVMADKSGNMSKFVNRNEFSRLNFLSGQFNNTPKQVNESFDEDDDSLSPNHHTVWGRMNPMHVGHEMVVNQAKRAAKKEGAGVSLVMTGSHDPEKNPLEPHRKKLHAERAFPGVDVKIADKSSPTILHYASELHNKGVRDFTLHVGSDRVDEFQNTLQKYNGVEGKKHGYYNFDSINVVAAGGKRDENADDVSGASATKMRQAAISGDRESFHKMAPSTLKPAEKDELMQDVKNGMRGPVKESLMNYYKNRFKTK